MSNTKKIKLDKDKEATIDASDWDKISTMQGEWHAHLDQDTKKHFATLSIKNEKGNKSTTALHRVISEAPKATYVLFLDGDTMNCTRENLLICTPKQYQKMQENYSAAHKADKPNLTLVYSKAS
jgi:hypothetical protein